LAAIERAERHTRKRIPHWIIAEHLGFKHSSATTRRLRPRLEVLLTAGSLSNSREHGRVLWTLTRAGRERLRRAKRAGKVEQLPESPQHREWRRARSAAEQRIGGLREKVREALADAMALMDEETGDSEAWVEASRQLKADCWNLGSATYCLREWAEPDDARADQESRRVRTLRNTSSWR
jgi:hypothetical protein